MPSSFSRTSREKRGFPSKISSWLIAAGKTRNKEPWAMNHQLRLNRHGKPLLELVGCHLRGSGDFYELLAIHVFLFKPDHVPPRHEVIIGLRVHRTDARLASPGIDKIGKLYRLIPAVLEHDHGTASAGDQELHRAESEITRILPVKGNGRVTAELIPDVLCYDGGADAQSAQVFEHSLLQHIAQRDLGKPDITVIVPRYVLENGQLLGIQAGRDAFGDDGHAVVLAERETLDDRALKNGDDLVQ